MNGLHEGSCQWVIVNNEGYPSVTYRVKSFGLQSCDFNSVWSTSHHIMQSALRNDSQTNGVSKWIRNLPESYGVMGRPKMDNTPGDLVRTRPERYGSIY